MRINYRLEGLNYALLYVIYMGCGELLYNTAAAADDDDTTTDHISVESSFLPPEGVLLFLL